MRQDIIDLYDAYTHGAMNRRSFMARLAKIAGGAAAANALLATLANNYALAATVPADDPDLVTETLEVPGQAGLAGYLVRPKTGVTRSAVMVIHENRGLNPHIKDVTRRVAKAGYLAMGLDFLSPHGGTPEDEDKGREMIGALDADAALASARYGLQALRIHPNNTTGKVGAVGFCWGGGMVNRLATADGNLVAGVAYYGRVADAEAVPNIRAAMLLHYAGLDERINAGIPAYRAALEAAGVTHEIHIYDGVQHAFNNDTAEARYDEAAATLAWERTLGWFQTHLS